MKEFVKQVLFAMWSMTLALAGFVVLAGAVWCVYVHKNAGYAIVVHSMSWCLQNWVFLFFGVLGSLLLPIARHIYHQIQPIETEFGVQYPPGRGDESAGEYIKMRYCPDCGHSRAWYDRCGDSRELCKFCGGWFREAIGKFDGRVWRGKDGLPFLKEGKQ